MSTARSPTQSHSIPLRERRRSVWPLLVLCAPIICLAVYYSPSLVSLKWHAWHGMSVRYRGLRVHVPFGWTALTTAPEDDYPENPQGVTIEKQPQSLAFDPGGPEVMYFNLLLPDPRTTLSQQVAEWQNFFRQAHPDSRFDLAPLAAAPSAMDCLEATPHGSPSAAALACVSLKDGWLAQFAGSKAHVPLFLEIAAGLKSKP